LNNIFIQKYILFIFLVYFLGIKELILTSLPSIRKFVFSMEDSTDSTNVTQNTTHQNMSFFFYHWFIWFFFIHVSNHPCMILVPKVLDGTNYAMWRLSMLISLSAKNKLGFINGSIPTLGESNPKYLLWQRCNNMVLSWILNSLNQELVNSVIYMETPSEI